MEYSFKNFLLDSLLPNAQAQLLDYALGFSPWSAMHENYIRELLDMVLKKYKQPGFLPLVSDEYIDRLDGFTNKFMSQFESWKLRLPPEICRAVITLHLPMVANLSEIKLRSAFERGFTPTEEAMRVKNGG